MGDYTINARVQRFYKRNPTKYFENQRATRERRREWKRKLVALKGGQCVDCGFSGHMAAMEFDHLDATKKVDSISKLISGSEWQACLDEIEKCDLVCANCHAVRTVIRGEQRNSALVSSVLNVNS